MKILKKIRVKLFGYTDAELKVRQEETLNIVKQLSQLRDIESFIKNHLLKTDIEEEERGLYEVEYEKIKKEIQYWKNELSNF